MPDKNGWGTVCASTTFWLYGAKFQITKQKTPGSARATLAPFACEGGGPAGPGGAKEGKKANLFVHLFQFAMLEKYCKISDYAV